MEGLWYHLILVHLARTWSVFISVYAVAVPNVPEAVGGSFTFTSLFRFLSALF